MYGHVANSLFRDSTEVSEFPRFARSSFTRLPVGQVIPVHSCFSGLALYRPQVFKPQHFDRFSVLLSLLLLQALEGCTYDHKTEDCEHVSHDIISTSRLPISRSISH